MKTRIDRLRAKLSVHWPMTVAVFDRWPLDSDCRRAILAAIIELAGRDLAANLASKMAELLKDARHRIYIHGYDKILEKFMLPYISGQLIILARNKHGIFTMIYGINTRLVTEHWLYELAAEYKSLVLVEDAWTVYM